MADDTYYAWTNIQSGKDNGTTKEPDLEVLSATRGDAVTADDLGLDEDQFKQLVDAGSVRRMKVPDMPDTFQGSPVDFLRQQARLAAEGTLGDAETSEENMSAILAANAASTGVALPPEIEEGTGPSEEVAEPDEETDNGVTLPNGM